MDIRDITQEVFYPKGNALGVMFNLQKKLLDHYVGIEGLPHYPIDINTKTSQKLLKDFIGRIVEELGEGFESYLIMLSLFHEGVDRKEIIPHLQNFNEEVADAIHFWLELMIYCGFTVEVMAQWVYLDSSDNLLKKYLARGQYESDSSMGLKKFKAYKVIEDDDLTDEFLRGGRSLSEDVCKEMKVFLWEITYNLQIARNTLKNKPWKQTQMMTDEKSFEDHMRSATISIFKFMAFAGFTPESIYEIYFKKNKVNEFRIKSKY